MPVIYNGKKLIPAPSIDVSKEYIKTGDGKKVGTTFTVVLEGQIIAHMGSPDSTGAFHESTGHPSNESITASQIQKSLFRKTEAIRSLFATEGLKLEITHWDGADDTLTTGFYGYPRVVSVSFPSNLYSSILPYTISLELDELEGDNTGDLIGGAEDRGTANITALLATEEGNTFTNKFYSGSSGVTKIYLSSLTEDWNVNSTEQAKGEIDLTTGAVDETPTYTLSHNSSAVGKRTYDSTGLIKEPWEHAKVWVDARAGLPVAGTTFPVDTSLTGDMFTASDTGFLIGDGSPTTEYFPYNHVRAVNIDKAGGTYSAQETWLLAQKGTYDVSEQINVEVTENESNMADITNVVFSGTITGYEKRNNNVGGDISSVSQTKYASAEARFNAITDTIAENLAEAISGKTITTPHISKSVTRSKSSGVISFSYTFNTRPQLVPNSITETGNFQENTASTKYAVIEIPNRTKGPIVQSLGTKDLDTATATASVTMGQGHRANKPVITDSVFYDIAGVPKGQASAIIIVNTSSISSLDGKTIVLKSTDNTTLTYTFDDDTSFEECAAPTVGIKGVTSAAGIAHNLAASINAGHAGAIIASATSSVVTLTQYVSGINGNKSISGTSSAYITYPSSFSGGTIGHAIRGGGTTYTLIVTSDQESYEKQSGRYSRTKSWQISENC